MDTREDCDRRNVQEMAVMHQNGSRLRERKQHFHEEEAVAAVAREGRRRRRRRMTRMLNGK